MATVKLPPIFSNRQFKQGAIVIASIVVIYIIINAFVIGGDAFIFSLNSSISAPLAVLNAILAVTIWRHIKPHMRDRSLYAGLILGWALWALAEVVWTNKEQQNYEDFLKRLKGFEPYLIENNINYAKHVFVKSAQ